MQGFLLLILFTNLKITQEKEMLKQTICLMLIVSLISAQTPILCQEIKNQNSNNKKNASEQEKKVEQNKEKPKLIEQPAIPVHNSSISSQTTNEERLTGKVGVLKYSDGNILDEFGVKYLLSKEATENLTRSIYDIDTITDDKLDVIIKQNQTHQKNLNGIGKVAGFCMGLSLALVGVGLGLALSEPDDPNVPNDIEREVNTDVGKDLMKYGGYGFLGSLVFLIPIGLSLKKSADYIQTELIDQHNNILKNEKVEPNISMYLGFGVKNIYYQYVPTASLSINF